MAALETDAISGAAIVTEQTVGAYTVPAGITSVSCRVYLELLVSSAQTLTLRVTNTPTGESEATVLFYSTPKHTAANTAFILESNGINVETGDVLTAYVTSSVADTVDGHCKWFDATDANVTKLAGVVQSLTDLKDFADTGYNPTAHSLASTGLDSIAATDPEGVASTFPQMVVQLWRRFFKKSTLTSTELKTYADNNSDVNTTQTVSDDGTTQTQGTAS